MTCGKIWGLEKWKSSMEEEKNVLWKYILWVLASETLFKVRPLLSWVKSKNLLLEWRENNSMSVIWEYMQGNNLIFYFWLLMYLQGCHLPWKSPGYRLDFWSHLLDFLIFKISWIFILLSYADFFLQFSLVKWIISLTKKNIDILFLEYF